VSNITRPGEFFPDHVLSLNFKGWERYDELKRGTPDTREAFMAMKFGQAEITEIFQKGFRRAAERAGFLLKSMQETQAAGLIDDT
jgi:hypothetical protein